MSPYTAFGIIVAVTLSIGFAVNGFASAQAVPNCGITPAFGFCHGAAKVSSKPTAPFDCLTFSAAKSLISEYGPGGIVPSMNPACIGYFAGYYTPTQICASYWTGYFTPSGVCPDPATHYGE
jgi:hypothetical protein